MDFSQLMKLSEVASNPQVQQNALSIENILKEMGNLEKIISHVDKFVKVIETSPTLSMAVKIAAKQNGFDKVEPLRGPDPAVHETVVEVEKYPPSSDLHRQMFIELNKIPEVKIREMLEAYRGSIQTEIGQTDNQ